MSDEKVVSLHKAGQEVKPPDGWRADSPFGHLKIGDTPLARLGDVLRWLEGSREWPREEALLELLGRLPSDAVQWVHWVNVGKKPIPVNAPDSELFGFQTAAQRHEAEQRYIAQSRDSELRRYYSIHPNGSEFSSPNFGNIRPYSGPKISEPGLPALKLLLSCWSEPTRWIPRDRVNVDTVDLPSWPANHIAVPMAKAAEWWGYGRTMAAQHQPSQSPAAANDNASPCAWDGKQLADRLAQLKADGKGKPTQRLVSESGVPEREIRRRVAAVKSAGSIGGMAATLAKGGKPRR